MKLTIKSFPCTLFFINFFLSAFKWSTFKHDETSYNQVSFEKNFNVNSIDKKKMYVPIWKWRGILKTTTAIIVLLKNRQKMLTFETNKNDIKRKFKEQK